MYMYMLVNRVSLEADLSVVTVTYVHVESPTAPGVCFFFLCVFATIVLASPTATCTFI